MKPILVDLHCHILPGIDDGAKNVDMSLELLRAHEADGVKAVMFTPHFHYERITVEEFAVRRRTAYLTLARACKDAGVQVAGKLGSEVYFTPALPSLDLSVLGFAGTRYLLMELPTTYHPSGIEETLYGIMQRGYTPILAHVERYPYVTEKPDLLYDWVTMGALAQVNTAGLIRGGHTARLIQRYLKWNLVHLLCTDAHHPQHRPANLKAAHEVLPPDVSRYFMQNGEDVFWGRDLRIPEPHQPRYRFGQWV